MAKETTLSTGGDWFGRATKRAGETAQKDRDRDLAALPAKKEQQGGGDAKTVEGALTPKGDVPAGNSAQPESKQQASATKEPVPQKTVEGAGGAVEQKTSESPTVTGRASIKVESEEALIELPGQKPMTAKELAWQLEKARNTDRRITDVQQREERLRTREQEPPKPEVKRTVEQVPARKMRDKPKFAPPRGVVDGDPEYEEARAEYQSDLAAWKMEESGLDSIVGPMMDKIEQLEAKLSEKDNESVRREQTLEKNRTSYNDALSELPFTMSGLSEETQGAVFEQIRQAGLLYGFDIKDPTQMRSKEYGSDAMARAVLRAFPPGSLPPGYERAKPSDALLSLDPNKPLVDKPKPDPLPETGPAGLAYPNRKEEKQKGPQDFGSRVNKWMKPTAA